MSKKQNEEALEQAIGGLGGEVVEQDAQEAGRGVHGDRNRCQEYGSYGNGI